MTQADQLASILEDCRSALMECDRDCDYALIERIDAYRAQATTTGAATTGAAVLPEQAVAYGFESGLVQLLNEARCHSARTVGNRELAAKIIEYMKLYASTPQVAQPLAVEQIEALAHRIAWRYKKSSDPHHSDTYTFNRSTLIQFAAAISKEVQG